MSEDRGVEEAEDFLSRVANGTTIEEAVVQIVEGAEALLQSVQRGGGIVSSVREGRTRYGDPYAAVIFGGGGDPAYAFDDIADRLLAANLVGHRLPVVYVESAARGRVYRQIVAVPRAPGPKGKL